MKIFLLMMMLKVKVKIKVKVFAFLVNVNKNIQMFSQINTLRWKLIYIHYCQSKNCECSVSMTIWKSAYWGPVWTLLCGPAKDPFI